MTLDRAERALGDLSDHDVERARTHLEKADERLDTVEEILGDRGGADEWLGDGRARLGDVWRMLQNEHEARERDDEDGGDE